MTQSSGLDSISVHPIIKQIIDRDCHVGESNLGVVRHVISRLRDGYRSFKAMPAKDRKLFIKQCLHHHRENFRIYVEVMSGFSQSLPASKMSEIPAQISGRQLSRLMRKNRMTIEMLAFRLGIARQRVRQARQVGISDALVVRDWVEAITGVDPGPLPHKHSIRQVSDDSKCGFCDRPFEVGDIGYRYVGGIFCSMACCRKSRGW